LSDTSALYEPLIERDLAAIPAAARAFAEQHSADELWIAVARFAVLAYAPSQHAKRAVMACRAAHDFRSLEMIIECARYAAESRQPWSEPPILDPPQVDEEIDLHAALGANDRIAAEHWLASHLDSAHEELRSLVKGDALLMFDAAVALERLLGEKGRYALLRMVIAELLTPTEHPTDPIEILIDRAIKEKGAIDSVRDVLIAVIPSVSRGTWAAAGDMHAPRAAPPPGPSTHARDDRLLAPYPLARDYAQTLLAHAIARKLPLRADEFLAAVHHNLEHGESFAEWSFA
jgi:hypothetical protein